MLVGQMVRCSVRISQIKLLLRRLQSVSLVDLLSRDETIALRNIANRRWVIVLVTLQLGNQLVMIRHNLLFVQVFLGLLGRKLCFLLLGSLCQVLKCHNLDALVLIIVLVVNCFGLWHLVEACDEDLGGLGCHCGVD